MSKPSLILLIEDDETTREFLNYLLGALGYDVIVAADGVEGVEAADSQEPDLVLCDIQMPRLDGFGVLRHLRDNPAKCHVPVVAVTAAAMVGDRERMLSAGFTGYIEKPVDPMKFGATVASFLSDG